MQPTPVPLTRDLVMIGGGHTHALVLRKWGMKPVPGARLTLINPGPTAPYSGMLPGHIAGHYRRDELEIALVRLARFAGARLILGAADGIDPEARVVHVPGRPPIPYDLLSVDVGITTKMAKLPGFEEHGTPAKPLAVFADRWEAFCDGDGPAHIAIIGGGIAGVELSMACAHRLRGLRREVHVTLVDRGAVLSDTPPASRQKLLEAMGGFGVVLKEHSTVSEVMADAVRLDDGTQIQADLTIGAAGAVPHPWLADCGIMHENGYLSVDDQLRSVSHKTIYACGDCANLTASPRPKAGVFAVRQAPVLAHNLRADLTGSQRRSFTPQRDFLKLVSLGGKVAIAEKLGLAVAGPGMWRWKNRIDQTFMDQFRHLPEMPAPKPPNSAALGVSKAMSGPAPCGGCGAKLGAEALESVVSTLPPSGREDVETRPGDDAAVLRIGDARQVITTDHLRAFAEDPALVARAAAIHALGDIWAMGAKPQAALATVILPRMVPKMQEPWLREIMVAATEVFTAEGAEVVGGHSSEGSELTIGFTITGVLDGPAITLAGAKPGDALILTKPIGTGTLLAAEMRHLADGRDVARAWDQMTTSQADAAAVLASVAHTMTDVTGFGLAGHLHSICTASGVGAELSLSDIPVLPGAEALSAKGIHSTLYPQNRAALDGHITPADTPRARLLFDPQTAGGLLAAIPADQTAAVLDQLGPDASQIGTITDDAGTITLSDRHLWTLPPTRLVSP
ncbi:MAG: selenide, water dikinase SelD [Pseudomonadota bacterium]